MVLLICVICSFYLYSMEQLNAVLPEGLPAGMLKEFEDSKRDALLVRQSFLDLRDNYRRIVDPPSFQFAGTAKGPIINFFPVILY